VSVVIADTPGHDASLRARVNAAGSADTVVVLVDARHGVLPQTRLHLSMADQLGFRHVLVAVNKMDLVGNEYEVFKSIKAEILAIAEPLGMSDLRFFPISDVRGTNVAEHGLDIDWYEGPTLLEALESIEAEHEQQHALSRAAVARSVEEACECFV